MKKYRYGDPKSFAGRRFAYGQFLKFFIGWNVIGYCLWTYMKTKTAKKDPNFNDKSTSEKILSMMGYKDVKQIKYHVRIRGSGISVEKVPDESIEKSEQDNCENDKSQTLPGGRESNR